MTTESQSVVSASPRAQKALPAKRRTTALFRSEPEELKPAGFRDPGVRLRAESDPRANALPELASAGSQHFFPMPAEKGRSLQRIAGVLAAGKR